MVEELKVVDHELVPKHTILSKEEKSELLKKYNIQLNQMPKISIKDPAIENLEVEPGDILQIERKSATNITATYFRLVE